MVSQPEVNMKKFLQISILVILALALVFSVFTVTAASSEMAAGKICPSVGWNSRSGSCALGALQSLQGLAYFKLPPPPTPQVGWNS